MLGFRAQELGFKACGLSFRCSSFDPDLENTQKFRKPGVPLRGLGGLSDQVATANGSVGNSFLTSWLARVSVRRTPPPCNSDYKGY